MRNILLLLIVLISSLQLSSQSKIDIFLASDSLLESDTPELAEEYLLQLRSKNPYNGEFQYELGEIYFEKQEFRKSISHFRKAQELGHQYRSNYYLACNYMGIGDHDSAVYFLEKHLFTPMNGQHPNEDPLADSAFIDLREHPGYLSLLPPEIIDSTNRDENWIADIDYFSDMLKKKYYDPFYKIDEATWDQVIEALKQDVPSLNDEQIIVRISQFLALMGDGHMNINDHFIPGNRRFKSKILPISVMLFSDGLFVVRAPEGYHELLGAKITGVNGHDFDEVFDTLCSAIAIDNEMGYKLMFYPVFRKMSFLYGLGISDSPDYVDVEYEIDGIKRTKTLYAQIEGADNPKRKEFHTHNGSEYPKFLENIRYGNVKWYWAEYLEEENILYVQINAIISVADNPLDEFCDSISDFIKSHDLSAFVLDIRKNGGGNSFLNINILEMMLTKEINQRGKSFTVIGPNTFSAAQNLTNVIENYTETIFIGEPSGSNPHFIGEVSPFKLPYSGLTINASNIYHQNGFSSDTRTWVAPDIYVGFSFDDYKNGRDPVMDEIIKFTKK